MLDEPIFLLLAVILTGELLGRARLARVSLGSSGILFAALVFGLVGHVLADELQTLGLVLFICAVGRDADLDCASLFLGEQADEGIYFQRVLERRRAIVTKPSPSA